ncbi:MAG: hypothetical protein HZA93_23630 [Verrucomicrobia bacterium]|nr:hypothetical protein [Verrucomicrobiota bacterium]
MNTLGQFLDDRRAAGVAAARQQARDGDVLAWLNRGAPPEVRLLKFDAWVRGQLATRLDWTWAGAAKEKRIEQCRVYLERLVLDLWRRGWMLDGKRLAAHLEGVLDNIGAYQRAGKVADFWPYFRACVDRYVGANAEEIQYEARTVGAQMGQLISALGIGRSGDGSSLPELVAQRAAEVGKAKAETLREKLARQREREAARKADATQPRLL